MDADNMQFIKKLKRFFLQARGLWTGELKAVPADSAILPSGCRPIPAGHYNFDPQAAKLVGVGQAVVLEKIRGWLLTNQAAGRNQRKGRTWTYNSAEDWQAEVPFWHHKTIEKYLRELAKSGLLHREQLDGPTAPYFYSLPDGANDSNNASQLLLWGKQELTAVGSDDSDSNTSSAIHQLPRHKPQPAATRRRAPKLAGAVAEFPNPTGELPEGKASREAWIGIDEHEAHESRDGRDNPPPSFAPPPSPTAETAAEIEKLPPEITSFWAMDGELRELIGKVGITRTLELIKAAKVKPGLLSPEGFARVQLRELAAAGPEDVTDTDEAVTDEAEIPADMGQWHTLDDATLEWITAHDFYSAGHKWFAEKLLAERRELVA